MKSGLFPSHEFLCENEQLSSASVWISSSVESVKVAVLIHNCQNHEKQPESVLASPVYPQRPTFKEKFNSLHPDKSTTDITNQ